MYHRLKCFEDGTAGNLGYPCGEWDYLTYNYLFDHTGLYDSTALTHPVHLINDADFEEASLGFGSGGWHARRHHCASVQVATMIFKIRSCGLNWRG